MPAACPRCMKYEYLTKPDGYEVTRDSIYPFKDIVCENCGWVGEYDDLAEAESHE